MLTARHRKINDSLLTIIGLGAQRLLSTNNSSSCSDSELLGSPPRLAVVFHTTEAILFRDPCYVHYSHSRWGYPVPMSWPTGHGSGLKCSSPCPGSPPNIQKRIKIVLRVLRFLSFSVLFRLPGYLWGAFLCVAFLCV